MSTLSTQIQLLRKTITRDYTAMLREPGGALKHPFIVPGSAQYLDQLWDWDSWLTNVALRQIVLEHPDSAAAGKHLAAYERGSILNFLSTTGWHGWMPIMLPREGAARPADPLHAFAFQPNTWTDVATAHPPTAAHAAQVHGDERHYSLAEVVEDKAGQGFAPTIL